MTRKTLVTALGALGIVPFFLALWLPDPALSLRVFSTYSLAILSFLAGSWWATALVSAGPSENQRLPIVMFSNVVVLLALGLVLWSDERTLLGLAGLYIVQAVCERRAAVFEAQPAYYRTMRSVVTAVVVGLHVLAWLLSNGR
ncbi:MAG: DUF3429 domain-containing protein [Pseudomonadales bacterium]|nr:DUF3429 domain-containing protein [Pseudomonadales bacterium]MBO7007024.1 DUF3429 domain-containing protein [Pseudomonadales bacterium]